VNVTPEPSQSSQAEQDPCGPSTLGQAFTGANSLASIPEATEESDHLMPDAVKVSDPEEERPDSELDGIRLEHLLSQKSQESIEQERGIPRKF
jgi:hypothetical protein